MSTTTCPQCGAVNPPGSKFCDNCGISLTQHLRASQTGGIGTRPAATGATSGGPAAAGKAPAGGGTPPTAAVGKTAAGGQPAAGAPPTAGAAGLGNTPLAPGVTLEGGRYVITKALGKGGMGSIFLAHDTRLHDKLVVIKEMLHNFANEEERIEAEQAFEGEMTTLSGLRHPNIPQITDFPTESGRFFI